MIAGIITVDQLQQQNQLIETQNQLLKNRNQLLDESLKKQNNLVKGNFLTDNQGHKSSIRLMSFFALITAIIFGSLSLINAHKSSNTNNNSSSSDVNMTFIFLVAAFAPKALQKFAETKADCYYITAAGLTANADGLHFDAISQRKFGIRYFESFLEKKSILAPLAGEEEMVNIMENRPLAKTEKAALLEISFASGELLLSEFEEKLSILNGH